jgi:hypothetical protein
VRARGHRRRHRHLLGTASRWEAFKINSAIKEARRCQKDQPARRSVKKGHLTAFVLAGSLATATIATPTPAQARWGWGWGLGALALGAFVGAALARPAYAYGYYPAYSYGYPAYSYGYAYPAYSYGYAYPRYAYGGYYRGYRPYYRPALYGGYRVARRVAIHRARWR